MLWNMYIIIKNNEDNHHHSINGKITTGTLFSVFVCVCVCVCVCVLATPGSMWDLSSPTRNQTQAPCLGSLESQLQQQEHLDLHNRLSLYLQN